MSDNIIEHYGVKGMKWGVRKDRSRTAGSSKLSRARTGLLRTRVESQSNLAKETRDEIKQLKSAPPGALGRLRTKLLRTNIESQSNLVKEYSDAAKADRAKGKTKSAERNEAEAKKIKAALDKDKAKLDAHLKDGGKSFIQRNALKRLKKEAAEYEAGAQKAAQKLKERKAKFDSINKQRQKERAESQKQADANNPAKLSNKELKTRIERMNLEKQYNKLTAERAGKTAVQRGKSAVAKAIQDAGQEVAKNYAKREITRTVDTVDKLVRAYVENKRGG